MSLVLPQPAFPSQPANPVALTSPTPTTYEQQAEAVAWRGIQRAVQRLALSFSPVVFSGAHPAGTYDVLVLTSGAEATVTAFGSVLDDQDQPVVYQLRKTVLLEEMAPAAA